MGLWIFNELHRASFEPILEPNVLRGVDCGVALEP